MDEPLIYTSKGNIPVASLEYRHYWEDAQTLDLVNFSVIDGQIKPNIEKGGYINFIDEYWLDDECVKRSVHSYQFKGLDTQSNIGNFNG